MPHSDVFNMLCVFIYQQSIYLVCVSTQNYLILVLYNESISLFNRVALIPFVLQSPYVLFEKLEGDSNRYENHT